MTKRSIQSLGAQETKDAILASTDAKAIQSIQEEFCE